MKKTQKNDPYFWLFIKIAFAFLTIAIVFPFLVNFIFKSWTTSGTFGDTFGALNAVFSGLALAGVIVTILIQRTELKNQRQELSLQRREMKETRKEFLLSRTTTLVYSQLDRFEKSIREFSIYQMSGYKVTGNDAIDFLNNKKIIVTRPMDKPEDQYYNEMKKAIIDSLLIYAPNKSEIEKLSRSAFNSVQVLKRLIFKTEIEIDQLNDLKHLFFDNVGFINMGVLNQISQVADDQFKFLEAEDYSKNNIDPGDLMHSNIFLKPIRDFYSLKLTKENYESEKKKWEESIGIK